MIIPADLIDGTVVRLQAIMASSATMAAIRCRACSPMPLRSGSPALVDLAGAKDPAAPDPAAEIAGRRR